MHCVAYLPREPLTATEPRPLPLRAPRRLALPRPRLPVDDPRSDMYMIVCNSWTLFCSSVVSLPSCCFWYSSISASRISFWASSTLLVPAMGWNGDLETLALLSLAAETWRSFLRVSIDSCSVRTVCMTAARSSPLMLLLFFSSRSMSTRCCCSCLSSSSCFRLWRSTWSFVRSYTSPRNTIVVIWFFLQWLGLIDLTLFCSSCFFFSASLAARISWLFLMAATVWNSEKPIETN